MAYLEILLILPRLAYPPFVCCILEKAWASLKSNYDYLLFSELPVIAKGGFDVNGIIFLWEEIGVFLDERDDGCILMGVVFGAACWL